ncbi:MAG: YfiR family protein [Terriglobia bacterium]
MQTLRYKTSPENLMHDTNRIPPKAQHDRVRRHQRRVLKAAVLVASGVLVSLPGWRAGASAPTEYEVKAAYLYNFGRFVQWPAKAGASGPFSICVLGDDPFGPALDAIVGGETISGKNVVVRRIMTPQDAAGCRVLYISSSEDKNLQDILSALDGSSVLTVSDIPQFTQRGGMIHLITQGDRVHFEVNLAAASRVGLTLSSQLLKLAVNVERNPSSQN